MEPIPNPVGFSLCLSRIQLFSDWVELPAALARKYPNAGREWAWQWVFPATRIYVEPQTGERRRHHLHESVLQRAVKEAIRRAASRWRCAVQHGAAADNRRRSPYGLEW